VVVIFIGANDVTHQVLPSASVRSLAEAVRRLVEAGVEVVVGTCPDLGTIKPIGPPLKQIARSWSRRLAAAQTIAVVEEGGRTVSLGSILGAEFLATPEVLFGPDRFHPSAEGYRAMASVVVPSVVAALELGPETEAAPPRGRGEGVLPVATAAVKAVKTPGTELDGTEIAGSQRGLRGRWVELRHRVLGAAQRGRGARVRRVHRGLKCRWPVSHSRKRRATGILSREVSHRAGWRGCAAGWCRSRPG
jgi:hypothetical protein